MAQILVILGFLGGDFRDGEPVVVYLGRDDAAGEEALAASDCDSFLMHRNLGAGHRRSPVIPQPEEEEVETDDGDDTGDSPGNASADKPKKPAKKKAAKKAARS